MDPAVRPRWRDFARVGVAAAALALGFLSLLVPLLPLGLLISVLVAGTLLRRLPSPLCLLGGGAGAAVPLLLVAWLNRGGPGQRCSTDGTTQSCTDLMNPWPWLGIGLVLLAGSLGAFAAGRRAAMT